MSDKQKTKPQSSKTLSYLIIQIPIGIIGILTAIMINNYLLAFPFIFITSLGILALYKKVKEQR